MLYNVPNISLILIFNGFVTFKTCFFSNFMFPFYLRGFKGKKKVEEEVVDVY